MIRRVGTSLFIVTGLALMTLTYFLWAAPVCNDSIECSEPNVQFSAALFVLGVILVFSSAVFYVVYKGEE